MNLKEMIPDEKTEEEKSMVCLDWAQTFNGSLY